VDKGFSDRVEFDIVLGDRYEYGDDEFQLLLRQLRDGQLHRLFHGKRRGDREQHLP